MEYNYFVKKNIKKGPSRSFKAYKYFFTNKIKDKYYDEKIIYPLKNKIQINMNLLKPFMNDEKEINLSTTNIFFQYEWSMDKDYLKNNRLELFNCIGKDGKYRSNYLVATWIIFSEEKLLIYREKANTILNTIDEDVISFYYEDIIDIKIEKKEKYVISKQKKKHTGLITLFYLIINNHNIFSFENFVEFEKILQILTTKLSKFKNLIC